MNLTALQLHTLLPDGTERTVRLANVAGPLDGINLINPPVFVKAELGAQYKILNIETGAHQKGQRLIRKNKDLKVFFDDEPAIEIQDYFVASLTPIENSPVYRLENESCNEVQVISHYPPETFDVPESLAWTESDPALDCKVALYNPSSFIGLIPSATAAVPATFGLGEIAATAIAIPVFTGGKGSTPVTPILASIARSEITSATGSLPGLIDSNIHWLNAGDGLFVSVRFNEAVFLNSSLGSPTLTLVIGNSTVQATYVSGSGSNALVFTTTIADGQNDNTGVGIALNALNLNGATLKDANGINATITSAAVADNANYLVDTTRPTVAITSDTPTLISGQTATITFTFSEDPGSTFTWNGTSGDVTLVEGTLTPISGTGFTRTAVFTPTNNLSSGSANITVNNLSYTDSAGNTGSSGLSPSISIDTLKPTVSIASNVATLKMGETADITFTFSENPDTSFAWDGSSGDLVVTGGSLGAISGTGLTRTAVFTPTANLASGTGSMTVTANSYQDAAGNNGSASAFSSLSIDTALPSLGSLALSSAAGAVASPLDASVKLLNATDTLSATVTFSEAVTLNAAAGSPTLDLVIGSSTVQASYVSGSGTTALVFSTTIASGQNDTDGVAIALNALSLNGATLKDSAGNTSAITSIAVANNPLYVVDTTAPTLSITSDVATLKSGETANITFTFSEDPGSSFVWASNAGDVVVSGGTLGNLSGAGLTRTATFTPTANVVSGTASLSVNAGAYTDAAGNTGGAGSTPLLSFSTSSPTISQVGLSSATGAVSNLLNAGDVIVARVVFSESIVLDSTAGSPTLGLTIGSNLVQAAYVSGSGSTDFVFSYTILAGQDDANGIAIPSAALTLNGSTLKSVPGNNVTLGNAAVADNILYLVDTIAPNVLITSSANTLKASETATITFTVSEDPGTSFSWNGSAGDLVVTGGTLGAISGTGLIRTATFTPTANLANGNASITVLGSSYQDTAGNLGTEGLTPIISIDTLAPAATAVALSASTGAVNQRLNAGDTLSATLTFNDNVILNSAGGSPTLALLVGSSTVQATYVSGSGSNALVFTTTIVNGQTDTDGVAIAVNALSLNGATLKDSAGNNSVITSTAVSSNSNYVVDTTAPTVAVTSNLSSLKAGDTATITFTFSEDPGTSFAWDGTSGDVVITGGSLGAISGSSLTRSATFTPTSNLASTSASVAVIGNNYQDAADNNGSAGSLTTLTVDTLAPSVSSLALTSATGSVASPGDATVKLLNATDTLSATVTFTEGVTVVTTAGSPTLALVIGSSTVQATYVSGSGTNALVFTTTIGSGQTDTDGVAIALNALTLNGATLKDAAGNSSVISSVAVADNSKYLVDTTAPSLSITSDVATLKAGETAVISFTFSEDPGNSFVWSANAGDVIVSGGTLGNISGTGLLRTATFTPTSNVLAGTASITVNAGTYTDAAGNTGGAGTTPFLTYSTTTPTVSQVGISSATGSLNNLLNAGDVILARVVFSEAIVLNSTLGSPTLGLTIGSTLVQAAYVSGSGSTDFVFGYTILAGQDDANGIAIPSAALTLNGSTLKSVPGNSVTLGNASVADNFLYPVDTTAPSVVITSSATSLKSGETSLICFTFSEDPDTSFSLADITVTGGTLSALTGLGTVRRSTFTPTPNLANGTASITVADLSYTDAAGNLGTAGTTPSISIDTLAPSISSVALSGSTGKVNNTLNAGDTLSVTATFNDTVILNTDGGVPTFKLSIGASTVYAAYVSGSGTNALVFTTTIVSGQTDTDGVAIPASALLLNGATLKDANGNTSSIGLLAVTSNAAYMVDTTGPTVAITSDISSLTVGTTANITFTFSEDPDTSFAWDGTSGDVVVAGGTLSAISGTGLTRTAAFTPTTSQGSGTASITVTGNSYQDAAGNNGAAGTTPTLNLDTLAPSITSLALTSSTGGLVSASDATVNNLNAGDTLSATVTFNDVITVNTSGGTPYLTLNVGGTSVQAAYVSGSGSNALVFTATVASGHNDINGVAIGADALNLNGGTLKDASGNNSTLTSVAVTDNAHYLVDTTRPTAAVSSSTSALLSGQTATITFTFSEDPGSSFVWDGTSGDLVVTGGTLSALSTTGNPLTRTAVLTPTSGVSAGTANVAISLNSYTDAAGNIGQEASAGVTDKTADISVTTTTTTVASVALLSATGMQNSLLNQGDVVSVAVNFTEAVFLNANLGTPSLNLTIGTTVVSAQYASGSGTAQLVFNYTILNGQTDVNGIAINTNSLSLNGKVLTDTAGNTPTLSFTAVGDNANYLVDTTAPTLVSIASSKSVFLSGETAVITFTFSEDPGSTFTWNGSAGDVTLVNGTLSALTGTGVTRSATFLPTQGLSGGNATITVSNNLYTDSAGNLGAGNTLDGLLLNTTPATLMDVQISSATGVQNNALNAGDVVTVTAHFSEAQTLNTTSGSPTVALQIGSSTVNATYASGAGTANLLFTYTIQAGQTDANGIAIGANALSLNGSTLQDPRANTTTLLAPGTADNSSYTVDTTAPFLSITSNVGQLKAGETANITFTFSEDPGTTFVWNGSTGDVTLSNGTLSAISGTGTTRTAVFTPTPSMNAGTASISVGAGTYQDAAGNNGSAGGPPSLTFDTLAPTVSSIALSSSTGILNSYLNEGDTANVSVTFSEAVSLNLTAGSPTLALLVGSSTVQATYVSGSGSNTLVFTTTIAAGQTDTDGIAIALNALSLNGAVLSDLAGNGASTNSVAVASNSAYMVDTLAPSVSLAFNVATLKAGETATLTLTANDKTGTSFTWNGTAGDLTVSGGTLSAISPFVLSGANYVSTATFTPTAGSTTAGVVSTASAAYTDLAGNPGQIGSSASVSIDTSAPTLTNMNITGASGILSNTLNAGDVVQITATFSEDVVVNTTGGTPKVLLNIGGLGNSALYVSGSGTTDLLFNYTILAGDTDTNGVSYAANALLLNGGTLKDSAGNSAVITAIARADNALYKVDTTAPTVSITSDMTKLLVGQTANIRFTFSEDPGGTFTWDGSAGDITLVNGSLSAISGTGTVRTAIFTPTNNLNSGNASIVVNNSSYADFAGNTGSVGTTPEITIDTLGPYITNTFIQGEPGAINNNYFGLGKKILICVYYNTLITSNFSLGTPTIDIVIGSTTVHVPLDFSYGNGSYLAFTHVVEAGETDTNGLSVIANSLMLNGATVKDSSGNNALTNNLGILNNANYMVDSTPPTAAITSNVTALKIGETATITFTFAESILAGFDWDGTAGDLVISNGTLSALSDFSGNGRVRTATFTPGVGLNGATASILFKNSSFQDYATNYNNSQGTSPAIAIDTLAPSLAITSSVPSVTTGTTATITFTFTEDPGASFAWSGTAGDVVVTQGTLGAISGTGLTRTAVFTPFPGLTSVAASITVAAGTYNDAAGNAGLAGTTPPLNVNTFKNAIYLGDIAANIGGYAIESPNINAKFGYAVSLAGDFNGDGYDDVVMGAPLNTFTDSGNATHADAGAAVLYEGGLNTSLVTKGYSGTGQVNGHYYTYGVNDGWFGYSVAGMGDVNNDGLADLLIGMPQGSSNPGGAFLVYGKTNSTTGSLAEYQNDVSALSTTPAALSITSTFDSAGFSVSSAGDVNGDGWIDMIIGAHFQTGSSALAGKSYVIYGGSWLSAKQTISLNDVGGTDASGINGFVISGWEYNEQSGTSVSSAGDFNGDGLADLLVGAIYSGLGGSNSGATYVVLGKTDNTVVNLSSLKNNIGGFVIKGENAQDKVGVSVSSGGDINGDGLGDIIIGAIIENTGSVQTQKGRTYVVFGRTSGNATIDLGQIASGIGGFAIVSSTNTEQSGHSVSSAGDINGDGLADIILGAPYGTVAGGALTGRGFVVYGKATTTNVSLADVANNIGGFAIIGQGSQDLSSFSVGAAGDVNGDGLADLIVGAPGYDANASSTSTGRSYIIFGSKTGPFAAGTAVDNIGTSANDTLTSSGGQTLAGGNFSAGNGNDTFIASGADVLLGGMGKDIFTVNASMITALQNNFGAGGNTSQLAKIDGGAGIDTLRMGGTGGLGFDFSLVSNTSVGNIESASRINSVERIDLRTDTASNQITLRVADVLDMAGSNWANLSALDTLGAGGWQNVGTGTSFSASGVKHHQVAIDGTSVDRVNTSGWTLQTTGTVRDANALVYDVYLATSNAPAMMLVQQDIIRFSIP